MLIIIQFYRQSINSSFGDTVAPERRSTMPAMEPLAEVITILTFYIQCEQCAHALRYLRSFSSSKPYLDQTLHSHRYIIAGGRYSNDAAIYDRFR
jgi:hypothetical protein